MARVGRPLVPSRLAPGGVLGAAAETPARPGWMRKVGAYVALTKPRIVELLLITTVPTMVVAAQGVPSLGLVAATLAGGALAAGGANAVNMVVDRDIDRLMHRTRNRPLVTGTLTPTAAMVFAVVLEAAAFGLLWWLVNPLSAVLALGACLFYVFVYTLWLKRHSTANIEIGGVAGAVPTLVGWAAVTNSVSWAAVVLFAIVFCWTPPHFWALAVRYADDYRVAGVPMLPTVRGGRWAAMRGLAYALATVALSFVLIAVTELGWIYAVAAAAAGAVWLWRCVALVRDPTAGPAMRAFTVSISYVSVLFVAMAVDVVVRFGW